MRRPSSARWAASLFVVLLSLPIGSVAAQEAADYARVVPASAITAKSFVSLHLVAGKVRLELPPAQLGVPMALAYGYDGTTVLFERVGSQVLLRRVTQIAEFDSAHVKWAANSRTPLSTVITVLPVEAIGPGGSVVVDFTPVALTQVGIFNALPANPELSRRSVVTRVAALPENVVIEVALTKSRPANSPGAPPTVSTDLGRWYLARLPDSPMRARRWDVRMGYVAGDLQSDGMGQRRYNGVLDIGWEASRGNIRRFRLEKKDPSAAVSDPIKPIVFYIEPGTPAKWRKWIKAGVEAWQPAFRAAGFSNAIIAKDAEGDSVALRDDFRNSFITWRDLPAARQRGLGGGSVAWFFDYRSGETLRCDVIGMGAGTINLVQDWYFLQASPLDPRAQSFPYPDSLLGALYQYVVSHEVGHCLGLQDGSYGKYAYPVDSLRSKTWMRTKGHSPSVLNYARNNYVAQPEDGIDPNDLIQRVGESDSYFIHWGYAPIPDAATPEAELPTLDRWIRLQDTARAFRFVGGGAESDGPYSMDANDDDDPIRSTGLGMKNLRRVMQLLPVATSSPGSDPRDLDDLYGQMLAQWSKELRRVVDMVGGSVVQFKHGNQRGPMFETIAAAKQRAAIAFLDSVAFATPKWLIAPEVSSRFEPQGLVTRVVGAQVDLLDKLLNVPRMHRLVQQQLAAPKRSDAYPLVDMLGDVRRGLWKELSAPRVTVDVVRQGLQLGYIRIVSNGVQSEPEREPRTPTNPRERVNVTLGYSAQEQSLLRAELVALKAAVVAAQPRAADPETKAHLDAARVAIEQGLVPPKRNPTPVRIY